MRRADRVTAVFLVGLAIVLGLEARRLAYWAAPRVPGPGFFPFWLAVGLALGALGIVAESRWHGPDPLIWFPSREHLRRVGILTLLTGLLALAISPLGMLAAVGLYFLAVLAIYTPGRWLLISLTAIGTPLALHLIFERWLKIPLPRGFLGV